MRPRTNCVDVRRAASGRLLVGLPFDEHSHDIALLHDQVLVAVDLHLGSRPLAEQHPVADLNVDRNQLAGFIAPAGANCDDLALLRLLLGGVGDDDAPGTFLSASIRVTTTRSWSGRNFISILLSSSVAWFLRDGGNSSFDRRPTIKRLQSRNKRSHKIFCPTRASHYTDRRPNAKYLCARSNLIEVKAGLIRAG